MKRMPPLAPATLADYEARLATLRADTRPHWGKMTPVMMLRHLRFSMEASLEELQLEDRSNFLTRSVLKWVITGPLPFPKGVPVPKEFLPEPTEAFEAERRILLEKLRAFAARVGEKPDHKTPTLMFGPFSLRAWSALHGKHFGHHFQQFGLL